MNKNAKTDLQAVTNPMAIAYKEGRKDGVEEGRKSGVMGTILHLNALALQQAELGNASNARTLEAACTKILRREIQMRGDTNDG